MVYRSGSVVTRVQSGPIGSANVGDQITTRVIVFDANPLSICGVVIEVDIDVAGEPQSAQWHFDSFTGMQQREVQFDLLVDVAVRIDDLSHMFSHPARHDYSQIGIELIGHEQR